MNPAEWAFRHHYGDVYRYVLRRTRDPHRAEELTQQVFVDAVFRLEMIERGSAPVLAWLYTVARRRLADESRLRRRTAELSARATAGATDPYTPALARIIRDALLELAPEARAMIVMKLLEGRSFSEISRRIGVSEPAARMRFVRALRALRDELEQRGIEPGER